MRLWKRISDLTVTRYLRFAKNATLKVTGSDGTETDISLDELKNVLDSGVSSEELTAASTLTAADSGKTLYLNSATEFATTLPTPADGLNFRFIVKAAPSGASYTVVTNGGSNVIQGSATVNGAAVPAVNEDTITFTASAAAVGDWVDLISDGTNWYVSGQGVAATAVAFTAS